MPRPKYPTGGVPSMIVGLGVDLIRIERLRRILERHGERARRRFFTPREVSDCDSRPRFADHLAGRLAAKEAAFKALGTGKVAGMRWQDVEVLSDYGGAPRLSFEGRARERADALGVTRSLVSLTHDAGVACAVVVLERRGPEA